MTLSVSQWIHYGPVSIQHLSSLRSAGFCSCTALNCAAVKQAQIITPPPLCTVVSKRFQVHQSTLSDCSTKTDVPPWMCAVKSTVSCGLVADVQSPVCFPLCACTITFRPTLERVQSKVTSSGLSVTLVQQKPAHLLSLSTGFDLSALQFLQK